MNNNSWRKFKPICYTWRRTKYIPRTILFWRNRYHKTCFLGVFSQAVRILLRQLHSWTMFWHSSNAPTVNMQQVWGLWNAMVRSTNGNIFHGKCWVACLKLLWQNGMAKVKKSLDWHVYGDKVLPGGRCLVAGTWGRWSRCIHSQEAESSECRYPITSFTVCGDSQSTQ